MSPDAILRIVVGTVAVGILLALLTYNRLVRSHNRVKEAWSGVEIQLGRRSNLIPNLVETVRGYVGHERQVFESVARARTAVAEAAGVAGASGASVALSQALGRLLALVEAYPALKASESFTRLHAELSDVEAKIAFARHFYNRTVLDYNTRVGRFPGLLIARLSGFAPAEFFEADESGRAAVSVSFARPETAREEHGA